MKGVPCRGIDRKRIGTAADSLYHLVVPDGKGFSFGKVVAVGKLGGKIERKTKAAHNKNRKQRTEYAPGFIEKSPVGDPSGKDKNWFHLEIPHTS